jgi:hypothetical protein
MGNCATASQWGHREAFKGRLIDTFTAPFFAFPLSAMAHSFFMNVCTVHKKKMPDLNDRPGIDLVDRK